jgi:hypothetical protein
MVGDRGLEPPTSRSQTARASQLRQSPLQAFYYKGSNQGLGHVPRPRNFAIDNKLSSEGFLAKCHWHFSPPTSRSQDLSALANCANPRRPIYFNRLSTAVTVSIEMLVVILLVLFLCIVFYVSFRECVLAL